MSGASTYAHRKIRENDLTPQLTLIVQISVSDDVRSRRIRLPSRATGINLGLRFRGVKLDIVRVHVDTRLIGAGRNVFDGRRRRAGVPSGTAIGTNPSYFTHQVLVARVSSCDKRNSREDA